MAELTEDDYLSIGEVLGLLLEEFPDVTISKIRFLESQGLIDPERTPSGYRKFYDADVELLRVILREQRENYLPLRVIKDRIETGVIDPSGDLPRPDHDDTGTDHTGTDLTDVPATSVAAHPAGSNGTARSAGDEPVSDPAGGPDLQPPAEPADDHTPVAPQLLPGVVLDRDELCAMVGLTSAELAGLEQYGVVHGRGSGSNTVYGDDAVEIAKVAVEMLRAGIDARHLRGWRTAAEREASIYEQLVTPRLRQRSPESRAEAIDTLRRLDELGGRLRAALMRTALRHHFES